MTAQPPVREALRNAERNGLLSAWYESEGRIHAIPTAGPPQLVRSVRDVENIKTAARRRLAGF